MAKGRPRGFDTDEILDKVVDAFWQNGFEGTSMADLTAATGLNKPSLYAALGNKEDMFRAAFARYRARQAEFTGNVLSHASAREGIHNLLLALVISQTQAGLPHGCLMVHGNLVGGPESAAIREELLAQRKAAQAKLRQRLVKAQADGEFPRTVSATDFSHYLTTVIQGLAVQAAGGATRQTLHRVVALAMAAWPTAHP